MPPECSGEGQQSLSRRTISEEGVVAHRDVRTGGVQDAQLVHTASGFNLPGEGCQVFAVCLAIDNQHRHAAGLFGRSPSAKEILGNDVPQ